MNRKLRSVSKSTNASAYTNSTYYVEWALISAVGAVLVGFVSFWPIHVTAGWFDQSIFHWPTTESLARQLPAPEIFDLNTATGPTYHLLASFVAWATDLSMMWTQFIVGSVCWAAVVGSVLWIARSLPRSARLLAVLVVVSSVYVLESTLWMTTDALTLALSTVALGLIHRLADTKRFDLKNILAIGLLIALACSVRQTAVWLLLTYAVAAVIASPSRAERPRIIIFGATPTIAVLAILFTKWGGFTPPSARVANGSGPEPLGIPVGFSLWFFFAAPLVIYIWQQWSPRAMQFALLSGAMCSTPALIWTSTYTYPDRMGGWLWKIAEHSGSLGNRSPAIVTLAFLGGVAVFLLLNTIHANGGSHSAWIIGVSIYASIVVSSASSMALLKYREIPLLVCFPLLVVLLYKYRRNPSVPFRSRISISLTVPALLQVAAAVAVVGLPIVRYIVDPASVPDPEWVHNAG